MYLPKFTKLATEIYITRAKTSMKCLAVVGVLYCNLKSTIFPL